MEKKYLMKSPEISQNLSVSVFYLVEIEDHMILGCDFARFGLNNMANGTKLSSHLLRQQFGIKPFGFLVKLLSPIVSYYRQQGKVMFSEASVILSFGLHPLGSNVTFLDVRRAFPRRTRFQFLAFNRNYGKTS